jgi:hypothetical protein
MLFHQIAQATNEPDWVLCDDDDANHQANDHYQLMEFITGAQENIVRPHHLINPQLVNYSVLLFTVRCC